MSGNKRKKGKQIITRPTIVVWNETQHSFTTLWIQQQLPLEIYCISVQSHPVSQKFLTKRNPVTPKRTYTSPKQSCILIKLNSHFKTFTQYQANSIHLKCWIQQLSGYWFLHQWKCVSSLCKMRFRKAEAGDLHRRASSRVVWITNTSVISSPPKPQSLHRDVHRIIHTSIWTVSHAICL